MKSSSCTLYGLSLLLFLLKTRPALLKALSLGVEVAWMHKIFFARVERFGKVFWFFFQNKRTFGFSLVNIKLFLYLVAERE